MALPALATWFEQQDAMDKLEPFLCDFGRLFYNVPSNSGRITQEHRLWTVPLISQGCVPMMAGQELPWNVLDR